MNSAFLPAQAADYLEANCLDRKPLGTLKKSRTARKLSDSELPTVFWMPPLSSETSENSSQKVTPQAIRDWLMLLPADSPARTFPSVKRTPKESGGGALDYGKNKRKSFASLDPVSLSWKTHQHSLFADLEKSLEIWPRWGFMSGGECWEVTPPTVVVTAKDYGLSLLRPTAQCWKAWTFLRLSSLVRKNHADGNIQEQSARCFHKMITPLSNEIMMQWPEGWTDLRPLAMDKSPCAQQLHGESFQVWLDKMKETLETITKGVAKTTQMQKELECEGERL